MEKITIKGLVALIEEAATAHPSVNQFGHGKRPDLSANGGAKAVYVFLEFPLIYRSIGRDGGRGPFFREYQLPICVLDQGKESELADEVVQIQSKCDLIAENIVAYLYEKYTDVKLTIQDYDTVTLENYHNDGWHGVRLELTVQARLPIDGCDVKGDFNG